jgi:hypothetical protein
MSPASLVISCDECVMQHSDACDDCVVTFLLDRDPEDGVGDDHAHAIVIDADEARAVRLLSRAGLAPDLRHSRRTG